MDSSWAQVARESRNLELRMDSKLDMPALVDSHRAKELLQGGKQTSQTVFVSAPVSRLGDCTL